MNVLDFALQMGKWGEEHYGEIADESTVPGIRAIFRKLAADQEALCGRFAAVQRRGGAGGTVTSSALDRAKNLWARTCQRAVPGTYRHESEAFRYGLLIQSRNIRLLEWLAGKETDGEAQGLLMAILQEERRLYAETEDLCNFVQANRWYPSATEYAIMVDMRGVFPGI